jgi:hypothetical protein
VLERPDRGFYLFEIRGDGTPDPILREVDGEVGLFVEEDVRPECQRGDVSHSVRCVYHVVRRLTGVRPRYVFPLLYGRTLAFVGTARHLTPLLFEVVLQPLVSRRERDSFTVTDGVEPLARGRAVDRDWFVIDLFVGPIVVAASDGTGFSASTEFLRLDVRLSRRFHRLVTRVTRRVEVYDRLVIDSAPGLRSDRVRLAERGRSVEDDFLVLLDSFNDTLFESSTGFLGRGYVGASLTSRASTFVLVE